MLNHYLTWKGNYAWLKQNIIRNALALFPEAITTSQGVNIMSIGLAMG